MIEMGPLLNGSIIKAVFIRVTNKLVLKWLTLNGKANNVMIVQSMRLNVSASVLDTLEC